MTKTLIVYLHGIGDNIMLTGVLREYKRRHPEESIDMVVLNRGCLAVWQGNPHVNSIQIYQGRQPHFWNPVEFRFRSYWRVRRYMKELNHCGQYRRLFFPTIQTLPEIIYHATGTYGGHKIERLARDLGVPSALYPYDLYTNEQDKEAACSFQARLGPQPVAVLHPFSGHTRKQLSAEGIGKIIQQLRRSGLVPVIVGAESERARLDASWEAASAFGLSFGVLIELLKRSAVFAGVDSAVAHLAAFANTAQILVFSPKLKPERYLPISERGQTKLIRVDRKNEAESLRRFADALADGSRFP